MKNVNQYFESYPSSLKVHETSDGFFFHEKNHCDAINHANTLKDKTITTHDRAKVKNAELVDDSTKAAKAAPVKYEVVKKVTPAKAVEAKKTAPAKVVAAKDPKVVKVVPAKKTETVKVDKTDNSTAEPKGAALDQSPENKGQSTEGSNFENK